MDNLGCVMNERKNTFPINQNSPTKKEANFYFTANKEYSLNQNLFDPSKSSPPNNFLEKLQLRMNIHNSFNNLTSLINE